MITELPGSNLALIGFMAAGKTSVGVALSLRTGLPFRDVDAAIQKAEGKSIHEIFASQGEDYFRSREGAIFRDLCAGFGQIIGCGGGTLVSPENRAILKARCYSIWLKTSQPEILRRIEAPGAPVRPLVEGADPRLIVPGLLKRREPFYGGAELIIDTDQRTVEEVVEAICLSLGWIEGSGA